MSSSFLTPEFLKAHHDFKARESTNQKEELPLRMSLQAVTKPEAPATSFEASEAHAHAARGTFLQQGTLHTHRGVSRLGFGFPTSENTC
ncbi:MAG: hypothetical protein ACOVPA_17480 [Rubrivivax sp.]